MKSEAAVQQRIRLEASRNNCILFRNNVGACIDQNGRMIRYGLSNESAQVNKAVKSGDLIGVTRVVVTPEMVGQVLGVFTSIEVKREGWYYTGTGREPAQQAWADIIKSWGGIAVFATRPEDVWG